MKVIVIDDESDFLNLVRLSLEEDNHEVVTAANGLEGLKTILREKPDVIISDIKMPGMDGDELFHTVRKQENTLQLTPFIFLSGHVDQNAIIERLNDGATLCLQKPISMLLLRAHVNACCARSILTHDYLRGKLEGISTALSIEELTVKELESNKSGSLDSIDYYINAIVDIIRRLNANHQTEIVANARLTPSKILDYIRIAINQLTNMDRILPNTNTDALSWRLILIVAEAQLANEKLPVSSLYLSAPSAKTTINTRINMLVEAGVFQKNNHVSDGRRQNLTLTTNFFETLIEFFENSLELILQQKANESVLST